jgi:hypothetical protein
MEMPKTREKLAWGLVFSAERRALISTVLDVARRFDNPLLIEIGVMLGHTSQMLLQLLEEAEKPARLICVDPWEKAEVFWTAGYEHVDPKNVEARFVLGTIHEAVEKCDIKPRSIAWCFVDGCHCYECALSDTKQVAPLMSPGGYLLFHDTDERNLTMGPNQHYHGDRRLIEVRRALEDSRDLEDFEFVKEVPGTEGRPGRHRTRTQIRRLPDGRPKIKGGLRVYRRK